MLKMFIPECFSALAKLIYPLPSPPEKRTKALQDLALREPLCKFLDKPIPKEEFPRGNVAAEFGPKLMEVDGRRFQEAKRNAAIVAASVVAVVAVAAWDLRST